MQEAPARSRTFRLPKSAYLAVLFLIFCTLPLAFAGDAGQGAKAVYGPRMLFLLIPVVAVVFIARTATIVTEDGIRVRAAFGSRRLRWDDLRGLNLEGAFGVRRGSPTARSGCRAYASPISRPCRSSVPAGCPMCPSRRPSTRPRGARAVADLVSTPLSR